jgi:hypothetical protein
MLHHPQQLVGMDELAAKRSITDNNFSWQIVSRDGSKLSYRKNVDFYRFSLIVEDGTVINAYLG